jgi:hypothetical protein
MNVEKITPAVCTAMALLPFLIGCNEPTMPGIRFQAIDAESGAPLAGVHLKQRSFEYVMFVPLPGGKLEYTVSYPPTGTDGIIVTKSLYARWGNVFSFQRDGYWGRSAFPVGSEIVYVDPPAQEGVRERWDARKVVKVCLYHIGSPSTRSSDSAEPASDH